MTELRGRLRLMVLTHPAPSCGRSLPDVVADCVRAGATAVQLRDKDATARDLAAVGGEIAAICRASGALFVVNDRLDVALHLGADGVHLGPDDLPVAAARAIVPPGFLIGYSTDDPADGRCAAEDGASYLGVGAVYGTRSKPGLEDEAVGTGRVREVAEESGLPVLGIGGIDADNAGAVFAVGAGVAVISAVMGAPDPARVVREILRA